jgi:hypothetical protein
MAGQSRPRREKVRGEHPKAHFASSLLETVSETVRLWQAQATVLNGGFRSDVATTPLLIN